MLSCPLHHLAAAKEAFRPRRKIVYSFWLKTPHRRVGKIINIQGKNMVLETGVAVSKQKLSDLKVRLLALKEHL
jgi:hypothetical protein